MGKRENEILVEEELPRKVRWYYKDKATGHAAYSLKEPLANILPEEELSKYEEIDEAEWNELTYVEPVEIPEPTAEEIARDERLSEIATLKRQLAMTDYIVIKMAEALARGDAETVAGIQTEYATQLADRIAWRARINELEAE